MIKPALFNTDMVRSILAGRKTVTRRYAKNCNDLVIPDMSFYDSNRRTYAVHGYTDKERKNQLFTAERPCLICPEDILYVRETWAFISCIYCNREYARGMSPCYDLQAVEFDDGKSISDGCFVYRADCKAPERITWHPSIHMPKAAARIWLKVTDVRVEKLHTMTLDDFLAEGVSVRPEAFRMRLIDADSLLVNMQNGIQGTAREYLKFYQMVVNDEPTADTIESLSAKLRAANMERSEEDCGGWIYCGDGENLPAEPFACIVTVIDTEPMTQEDFESILPYHVGYDGKQWNDIEGNRIPFEVIAWMYAPKEPYHEP